MPYFKIEQICTKSSIIEAKNKKVSKVENPKFKRGQKLKHPLHGLVHYHKPSADTPGTHWVTLDGTPVARRVNETDLECLP